MRQFKAGDGPCVWSLPGAVAASERHNPGVDNVVGRETNTRTFDWNAPHKFIEVLSSMHFFAP